MCTENLNGQMLVRYADGRVGSGRDPLDVEALFRELAVCRREPLSGSGTLCYTMTYETNIQKR